MINRKVRLKPSYAKWHLDHPDIYMNGVKWDDTYEEETLLHLVCCLGEPVYGRIIRNSMAMSNCWLVKFRVGNLTAEYFVQKRHVEFVAG